MLSGRDPSAMLADCSGRRLDGGGVRSELVPAIRPRTCPGGALARLTAHVEPDVRAALALAGAWWMRTAVVVAGSLYVA